MNAYFSNPFYPKTSSSEISQSDSSESSEAAVEIQIADIDHKGKINGQKHTLQMGNYLRSKGDADACFNRIIKEMNLISFKV